MFLKLKEEELPAVPLMLMGWYVLRKNFGIIFLINLIVALPLNFALHYLPQPDLETFDFAAVFINGIIFPAAITVLSLVGTLANAYITEQTALGYPPSFAIAFNKAFVNWGRAAGAFMLVFVFVTGGFLLFFVPGVYLSVLFFFSIYAVGLRNLKGMTALKYSVYLVRNRWWRTFGFFIAIGFLNFVPSYVLSALFELLPSFPYNDVVTSTISNILWSYFEIVSVLLFLNLDYLKRKEHLEGSSI